MSSNDSRKTGPAPASRRPRTLVLEQQPESRLARMFGEHPAPELFGLWLSEVVLGTLLLYGLLSAADGRVAGSATAAVALALGFGLTSVAVGLYNPDAYQETRQLLISTAVGAVLAFPMVWLLGHVFGVELAGLSWEGRLHAVRALLVWTLALFALRLGFAYAVRAKVFARRVVLIGPDAAVARLAAAISARYHGFFEVAAVLPATGAGDAGRRGAAGRVGGRAAHLGRDHRRRGGGCDPGPPAPARPGARHAAVHRRRFLRTPAAPDRRGARHGCRAGGPGSGSGSGTGAGGALGRRGVARAGGRRARRRAAPQFRRRPQPRAAGLHPAADAAHRARDQARQRRAGALPPGARGPGRAELHAAEVPQHAPGRRAARGRSGRRAAIRASPAWAASSASCASTNCRSC